MKKISAFLVDYSNQSALYRALDSLHSHSSLIDSVTVLHEENVQLQIPEFEVKAYTFQSNRLGETLNKLIPKVESEYVLFLHGTEYLTPMTTVEALEITPPHSVLAHTYFQRNISIQLPLLVQTSFLKKHRFPSGKELPFTEALFPVWLASIDEVSIKYKQNLIRRTGQHLNPDWIEKHKFLEKYYLEDKQTTNPSITIAIANYNMEKYIETAIASCLLQNEQPEHIYIIDDGSTDQSYQRMKSWEKHSNVTIFKKKNEGKAKALNSLLPHISTDFMLELDADDWLDPNAIHWIKQLLANISKKTALLYGNFRKWKQLEDEIVLKNFTPGRKVHDKQDLLAYHFPLGPRIYRTSALKAIGGFPVVSFQDGRLYEDVSVLVRLIENYQLQYENFTVYNVREHPESITKKNLHQWEDFLRTL